MELIFLSIFLSLLLVSLPLMFLFTRTKYQTHEDALNLPPGKTGWPFIGESLEFLNAGRKGAPEKFINDRMEKFSNQVFKTSILGESTAVLCGPPGNKFLFSNENKLVHAWWPSSVEKVFPSPGNLSGSEEAIRMRKLLPTFLKPEALQGYVSIMDNIAQKHLETNWENKKEVLVYPLAKSYTFALACKLFLSIDDPTQVERFGNSFAVVASGLVAIPIDLPGMPFNKAIKVSKMTRKDLQVVIKQRKIDLTENKAPPTQDILSHMLLTSDENGVFMNELDIANKILGLLIGGHDTASSAIASIVKYLADLPHIYDKVLKEQNEIANAKAAGELLNWEDLKKMRYSWNVACEVMRLLPPLPGAFREAITDFTYAGFSIPKGWKLYYSTSATHKNADYFPEPEKFDPSRFEGTGPEPYTFVPFGGGPRMCPGNEYARLEILVFMHHVVRKFKWEKVLPDEKMIVDPFPMPAKGLPIRLQPRV